MNLRKPRLLRSGVKSARQAADSLAGLRYAGATGDGVLRFLKVVQAKKLDRIAAVYVVGSWFLVQAGSIALPAFGAPGWTLRVLIAAAVVGLPLTLAGAWVAASHPRSAHHRSAPAVRHTDIAVLTSLGLVLAAIAGQLLFHWEWPSNMQRAGIASMSSTRPAPRAPAPTSIAVLPFTSMSDNQSDRYFSDGISAELISQLSHAPGLSVAARTSSFSFEGKSADIKTIAKALNVRFVLDGSVRVEGPRVRIEAELNSGEGFTLWSQTYSGDLSHILDLQDDIAGTIAQTLTHRLLRSGGATRHPASVKPEAYRDYLEGRYEMARRTDESLRKAIGLLQGVTRQQPDFAAGFAGLASAESDSAFNFSHRELIVPGLVAVRNTLRLDPGNTEALTAKAAFALMEWNWDAAAAVLHTILNLHDSDSEVLNMKALLLKYLGFPEQSLRAARASAEVDTLYGVAWANIASSLFELGRYEEASAAAANALALLPNQPDLMVEQCGAWAHSGHIAKAESMYATLMRTGAEEHAVGCNFEILLAKGDLAHARSLAHQLAGMPAERAPRLRETAGLYYLLVGEVEAALACFDQSYDRRELGLLTVSSSPQALAQLANNARWVALRNQPLFMQWQAAHNRIAADLQTNR